MWNGNIRAEKPEVLSQNRTSHFARLWAVVAPTQPPNLTGWECYVRFVLQFVSLLSVQVEYIDWVTETSGQEALPWGIKRSMVDQAGTDRSLDKQFLPRQQQTLFGCHVTGMFFIELASG
ncbi:hypothetical protein RRG08_055661 [Elysia crispata]|uniref:Uncharacterized protein n=1 Tax=Elysia crispata TaxID=231223 RepID=A0AAE0Z8Y6_9GAST|nr:hypothetical protein RRG08_055661 [Elysia crispata]